MRDLLTQAELNNIFYGEKPTVEVRFYSKEKVDSTASREAGHRVMKDADYIHLKCEKEKTEIQRPAQLEDQRRYPAAWAAYEGRKNESRNVPDVPAERPAIGSAFAQAR
jgi:hypothetical protein